MYKKKYVRGHTHKRNNLSIAIALNLSKTDHFLPRSKAIASRARKIEERSIISGKNYCVNFSVANERTNGDETLTKGRLLSR